MSAIKGVLKVKEEEKKIWLFGVLTECPLKEEVEGCLFRKYRQLSALERWKFVDKLTEQEVDRYIRLHKVCLYRRELNQQKKCVRGCRKSQLNH